MKNHHAPNPEDLKSIASELDLSLSDDAVHEFANVIQAALADYDTLARLPDYTPEVRYARTPGYRPEGDDNPFNAWARRTSIKGNSTGPLSGRQVVIKDNIAIAGVPMMNGASILEHHVSAVDATVVSRVLDAGAEIIGTGQCEYYCSSGGCHTNAVGPPVQNPFRVGYSAGGSSSGCAALVGAGLIDMAIGGDQGGSVRCPSAFCGVYGMKPTYGLVPYTGAMPIEATLDHLGPMTSKVSDNALLLEVLAGADGLDPRQIDIEPRRYTEALEKPVAGMRIGLMREGFNHPISDPAVDDGVRRAIQIFSKMGASVEEVSVPFHLMAHKLQRAISAEGSTALMMRGNGYGTNWRGFYDLNLMSAQLAWRDRSRELPPTVMAQMLIGRYMERFHGGLLYGKAQNLSRRLRRDYDAAFNRVDLLAVPTNPIVAQPIVAPDAELETKLGLSDNMAVNTAAFNVTGHPAMSIPCGLVNGLPIGLMLVAPRNREDKIYQAAAAFERSVEWRSLN